MSWCDGSDDNYDLNLERVSNTDHPSVQLKDQSQSCVTSRPDSKISAETPITTCPSCGHKLHHHQDDQVTYVNH
jgi:rRNA maturation endonuclease Nob1